MTAVSIVQYLKNILYMIVCPLTQYRFPSLLHTKDPGGQVY